MDITLPTFIALVGHPTCGKTTAAELLGELYGCKILDTGMVLREFCVRHLGLDWDQVMTQEGKKSFVDICGKDWQVRKILGDLGQKLEDLFGEEIMPYIAHQSVIDEIENGEPCSYVDPSCRKTQNHYWKRQGGLVIGINNPLAGPSQYAFDAFDPEPVDFWIENDALACGLPEKLAREDLKQKLNKAIIGWAVEDQLGGALAA